MAVCQFLDFCRRERRERMAQHIVQQILPQTVQSLKMLEDQNELFEVRKIKPLVGVEEGMGHRVGQILFRKVTLQVENIAT